MIDVAIIGGGAAGFFSAINISRNKPNFKVVIFEKSSTVLGKVKVSGGGRCNVTHSCFDPIVLSDYYPRGQKELLSVFKRFGPQHTIAWFEKEGINLVTESDGRMFPDTDDSQTIIDCFLDNCLRLNIPVQIQEAIQGIRKLDRYFELDVNGHSVQAKRLVICPGSSEYFWDLLNSLGHKIIAPVPSLFTFNIKDPLLSDLMGLSVANAKITLVAEKSLLKKHGLTQDDISQNGPMLITHWGLSGPSVLKLSSVAARLLFDLKYKFDINICFSNASSDETYNNLLEFRNANPKKQLHSGQVYDMPSRLWLRIVHLAVGDKVRNWADVPNKELQLLANKLSSYKLSVTGKSTFKEEFVTAGGVDLREVDFKTMESKLIKGMYFAGEVLNIDALTGGFNFQAAWSEALVISESV